MGIFMPSISVAGLVNLNIDQGSDTLFVDQKATAAWGWRSRLSLLDADRTAAALVAEDNIEELFSTLFSDSMIFRLLLCLKILDDNDKI